MRRVTRRCCATGRCPTRSRGLTSCWCGSTPRRSTGPTCYSGAGPTRPPPGASLVLGLELAGEVVRAAGGWRPGDRVMAVVTGGGYAELAAVSAGMALAVPPQLSYEQAAAVPEAFLTAFLNLFTLGRLQAGEQVLIHAGASGVG